MEKANSSPMHHAMKTYRGMEAQLHTLKHQHQPQGNCQLHAHVAYPWKNGPKYTPIECLVGPRIINVMFQIPRFQIFLWQGTTHVAIGWFVGRTWKNNTKCCTSPLKLLCNFHCVHIIYKHDCGPRNTTWLAVSWRHTI